MAPGPSRCQPLPSNLERIKDKLQVVLGQIEAVGYVENEKDVQTVSELMDDIRDAITDYQVSSDSKPFMCTSSFKQTGLDGEPTSHT